VEAAELSEYVGRTVVLDTATTLIYIGTLTAVTGAFLTLNDVDVHDVTEGASTKEIYALEARKYGVKVNRTATKVRLDVVISISLLEDIIEY
jgi:hypothetical protein